MDPVTLEQLAALRGEMREEMQREIQKVRTEMESKIESMQHKIEILESQNKTLRLKELEKRVRGESVFSEALALAVA
jgi:hypothetical protein